MFSDKLYDLSYSPELLSLDHTFCPIEAWLSLHCRSEQPHAEVLGNPISEQILRIEHHTYKAEKCR